MRAVIATLLIGAAVLAAPDVSGRWAVTMEAQARRTPDGGSVTLDAVDGELALTQQGSKVSGTWTARDTWALAGSVDDGGTIELRSEDKPLRVVRDGVESRVSAHWVFHGSKTGDKLSGTAMLDTGGPLATPRPWTATRP
jgi:hypothetical protein